MVRCSLLLLLVFVSWGLGSKQPTCRKRHHHHSTPSASELSAAFHDKYKNAGSNLQKGSRLMGGEADKIQNSPHHVAVFYYNSLYLAGGSMISLRAVLTAAAPVNGLLTRGLTTKSGMTELPKKIEGEHMNMVSDVVIHGEWDGYLDYNLAILFTKTNFFTNEFRRPIPITNCFDNPLMPGSAITMVGWGAMNYGGVRADKIRKGNMTVVNNENCLTLYKYRGFKSDKYICAGQMDQNTCMDDVGGGLVYEGQLYGVLVGAHPCGLAGWPSVFTLLTDPEIKQWVKTEMELGKKLVQLDDATVLSDNAIVHSDDAITLSDNE